MGDIRYRKISVQIWNDEKVRGMSDEAQLAFFFVLTHPLMTGIGAARLSVPGLSAERRWDVEKGSKAFREVFKEGLLAYDETTCLLWAPNFLKHNKPENPNVVKGWGWIPETLPDCPLKTQVFQSVKAYLEGLSEAFTKALPKAFHEGLSKTYNREQRTENKEQRKIAAVAAPPKPNPVKSDHKAFVEYWHEVCLKRVGAPYIFNGKQDGSLVQTILRRVTLAEGRELIDLFFQTDDEWILKRGGFKLTIFIGQMNNLVQRKQGVTNGANSTLNSVGGIVPEPNKYDRLETGEYDHDFISKRDKALGRG